MSLEFTAVPPVPNGMNLAGPSLFIDESYCKWMQDVLVDRPGQIRMRGPLQEWLASAGVGNNESALGACEHYTNNNNWRGAVFVASGVVTDGNVPTSNGKIYVYQNVNGVPSVVNATGITLPFKLTTKYDATTKRWINNTIIDAKPSIQDGVWITVFDDVTNNNLANNVAALLYWRGAGLPTYTSTGNLASWNLASNDQLITHASSVASSVEPNMFAFNATTGRYLGCVASVSGSSVTLEKNILASSYNESASSVTVRYMSFRGFVHQYGRGFATNDAGNYLTSGRLGSSAEGLFDAARVTVAEDAATHEVNVYRSSDHAYIAQVVFNGTQSNTQVAIENATTLTKNNLRDENYLIVRNDTDMYVASDANDSLRYPMDIRYRRPDQRPKARTLSSATKVAAPHPGLFTAAYAGHQWFASFNSSSTEYDKYINRVVFSDYDNPENVNLCQDVSDSIIIPGKEPIRGIAGSNAGLLVFVESKTFIIRGTNRTNFSLEELYPDGTLCATSIVQVGGGVIWAGKQGIYYYDGATVRNFISDRLGIYYTDGVKNFDIGKDRIYSFINNNYLVINFTNWFSSYSLKRWDCSSITSVTSISGTEFPSSPSDKQLFYNTVTKLVYVYDSLYSRWTNLGNFGNDEIINLTSSGSSSLVRPDRITFNIYLPTGAFGTLSNFAPRGYMKDIVVMNDSTNNKARLLDMRTIFTENVDNFTTDIIKSNDIVFSDAGVSFAGPDFYLETKQYNFGESTLRKWWRKLMLNLSINKGYMMVEFFDINDTSLVSPVTGTDDLFCNADESGFFLVPPTNQKWDWYVENQYSWDNYWASGMSSTPYIQYLSGVSAASAPTYTGVTRAYYNTGDNKVYVNGGSGWVELTGANGRRTGLKFYSTTAVSGFPNGKVYKWDGTSWVDQGANDRTWNTVFRGAIIRFSRWMGIRQNSLGFRFYSLRNYSPGGTENLPEVIDINDWVFGLKPLRKGRN